MQQIQTEASLRQALSTLKFPFTDDASASICELAAAYVDELKAMDYPPERVVVAVKQLAGDVQLDNTSVLARGTTRGADALLSELVRRSIEHYYEQPQSVRSSTAM